MVYIIFCTLYWKAVPVAAFDELKAAEECLKTLQHLSAYIVEESLITRDSEEIKAKKNDILYIAMLGYDFYYASFDKRKVERYITIYLDDNGQLEMLPMNINMLFDRTS